MPVTRTNRPCHNCGQVGIEEFAGMCAACASDQRSKLGEARRLWCRFCGNTRLFGENANLMRCLDRDCTDLNMPHRKISGHTIVDLGIP